MTEPAARTARPLRLFLALVVVVLVAMAALTWLNRKSLAREALTGWLRSKGIASEAEVYGVGPSTFSARLRIGDPRQPDFRAARADVRYRLKGLGVEVLAVTLRQPELRASFQDGRFSVGALDPLLDEFRKRPPKPDAARPTITIDQGVLWLATDYGPLKLTANARVEDNKLISLAAAADPARLRGRGLSAETGRVTVALVTRGSRVSASLDAPLAAVSSDEASLRDGRLILTADAPYPDLLARRNDGGVALNARLTARRLAQGDHSLDAILAEAAFVGQSRGWLEDLWVGGRGSAKLEAASADLGTAKAGGVRLVLASDDLRWTRTGGDRVAANLRATATLDRGAAAEVTLTDTAIEAAGPVTAAGDGLRAALSARLVGHGAYAGLGPLTSEDTGDMAAIKRAVRSFDISAPRVSLTAAPHAPFRAALSEPIVLRPRTGGAVTLAGGSAADWRLSVKGGELPDVDARARNLRFAGGEVSADLELRAQLTLGPLEEAQVNAAGRLRVFDGVTTLAASRCAQVSAERLEFGENDVEKLSATLCPGAAPLFRLTGGDWRISGRAEGVSADAPFLQSGVRDASGPIALGLRGGRLDADAHIDQARLLDLSPDLRFHPLTLSGAARARRDVWTADLAIDAGRHRVARAMLRHDGASGEGAVDIETGELAFSEGGLQPAQLSPLAEAVGSPASGEVQFAGRFAWTLTGVASAGELSVTRLDFNSPAGRVNGLAGAVAFTSLAPLEAAPGQVITVEQLDAIVPVTGLRVELGLKDEVLLVTGGEASVGGGKVTVERVELPLDPEAPRKGVLAFEGVQLNELVEASPFGDKVELDARVTGIIPFEALGQNLRVKDGRLRAIAPGRLSIQREALAGVETGEQEVRADGRPIADQAQANATVTDFAYQAMENLAFDQLDLTLNSLEGGRMSALFHIVGRHDPPRRQEIRLGIMELIRRQFLDRPLPLPSGTGVNLTLDTTLNLDDLLADYAEYQRLRSSGPVQP